MTSFCPSNQTRLTRVCVPEDLIYPWTRRVDNDMRTSLLTSTACFETHYQALICVSGNPRHLCVGQTLRAALACTQHIFQNQSLRKLDLRVIVESGAQQAVAI